MSAIEIPTNLASMFMLIIEGNFESYYSLNKAESTTLDSTQSVHIFLGHPVAFMHNNSLRCLRCQFSHKLGIWMLVTQCIFY